ncbi:DNA mismatch repair protein MutS [Acidithiobacillus acidisediminis]|uniref:endonuclease MutS2 n=1 Tax=Acidithiobacillus TaxID=119977 RepID=UPI00200C6B2F|nr:DNA mismatch repair protein MutS [Acidithiobacillus sp. S30A2]
MEGDWKLLDFEGIRRLLEKLSATPMGADAARNLGPAPTLASARQLQEAITAARFGLESGAGPVLPELPDPRPALRQAAAPGAALSGQALRNLHRILRVGQELRPYAESRPALLPLGAEVLDAPAVLIDAIDAVLLPNGSVREDGNSALRALHAELKQEREAAQRQIQSHLRGGGKAHWAGQRLSVHLPDGSREEIRGVRRGSGPGGHGTVVEPMELVAANNRLEKISGNIEQENQSLLRSLTDQVRELLPALQKLVDALTWLDLAIAGAQLSLHLRAQAAELVEEPILVLEGAVHPQLWLAHVDHRGPAPKPLSVRIDAANPILVVTGPNTGGKSVSLKTVGLLALMAQCGLHVPVSGRAVVGRFAKIFVDMGDPQSMAFALSTFSGHVAMLKKLLAEADDRTLILLDELGTGTDPEEGAAMAMAVLDELAGRGVRGMVTTHLTPIKIFAAEHPALQNASMRFDHERLEPTYELEIGVPGKSLGLLIAEKSGLPESLVRAARAHLQRLHQGA